VAKKRIGLALGGGSARGMAHIGVLEILEKENIPVDLVAGTSAGAVIGALYASGMSGLAIKEYMLGFDRNQLRKMVDLSLSRTGLISGEKLILELRKIMGGEITFSQLKKPFACVACDIITGEEVVMTRGSVVEAVRASISIPVVFAAVKRKGRYLIDGGLVNQVPVNIVRAMGADYVIAVNVVPRHLSKVKHKLVEEKTKPASDVGPHPNIFNIMMNTLDIANSYRVEASLIGADAVIEPCTIGVGSADFHQAAQCILQGELATIDAVLKIKRELAKF
jgi:NTE family protein